MTAVESVLDCNNQLGEGPSWHPGDRELYWVEVRAKRIHRWTPSTGEHRTWPTPELVTATAVRAKGGLVVASGTGLDFFDPATGALQRFAAPEKDKPGNRSNDGKC